MSFGVSNSFLEEFDFMFHQMLKQRGSQLMGVVQQEQVMGATKYLRQASVGDAHFVTDVGGPTEYTAIKYDKRKLEPKPFECPIMLDKYDMVMQGTPDVGQLAQEASDSCGILIDKIILRGIYGDAVTAASGNVPLPASQKILWNDYDLLPAASNEYPDAVKKGLSTSKVAKAVQMLRSKFNNAPLICVASNYAMSTLRADPRAANSLFNAGGPALSIGQNSPYGGCDAFIPSEQIERVQGNGGTTYREYAYIYALDQIRLGSSMPLTMDYGKNAERGLNDVIIYRGMYDCVRMQEEAVVRIEIGLSNAA